MEKKYRNDYYYSNNDNFISKYKYEPQEIEERILNPETEQYEYKKRIINLELELENQNETLKDLTIENIVKKLNK